jgi:vitellogenic carboxypeptidase-like protein
MAAKTAAESKPAATQLAGRKAAATLGPQLAGRLPAGPGRQYFYWLCPARTGDKAAPLLIWLNGGPGSSSMMGLFLENGPYFVSDDGSLHARNASWNNKYDVLYVDQPAGTGFSVAQSPDAYATNQEEVAEAFSAFLANFYSFYPDTRNKQLFLTGESYAGKYLPAIAARFVTHGIPVAGVAIGNGLMVPREMTLTVPASYYAVGILDQSQRDRAARLAADIAAHIDAGHWSNATAARSVLFDYIDGANGPNTAPNVDSFLKYGEYDESFSAFLNSAETKKSLNLPADATWRQESKAVHEHLYEDIMKPAAHLLEPVLAAGVPVLLYQGQLDVRDGVAATEAWLANWSWTGRRRFLDSPRKAWMSPGRAIAGYYRSCGGLTHLTVNGAGHLVPHDAPAQALDMIGRFVAGAFEEQC